MNSHHVKPIASPQAKWGPREAYFALAMEDGFGGDSGPSRGDPSTSASRPIEAFKDAVCYVRSTSILLKNSQIEQLRKSCSGAHCVVQAGGRHGKPYGRVTDGKVSQSAEPLRNFPSWLPAVF
jgi:hypothetical protein